MKASSWDSYGTVERQWSQIGGGYRIGVGLSESNGAHHSAKLHTFN